MNLNEAFRYSNFLENLSSEILDILRYENNVIKVTQTHLKNKAIKSVEDEKIVVEKAMRVDCSVNTLIDLLIQVNREQLGLSNAIYQAKKNCNFDELKEANTKARTILTSLKRMSQLKSSERKIRGSDYTFNNEGNQISYSYDVLEITQIDFDRTKVKELIRKITTECDENSTKIARLEIDTIVEHTPKYSFDETLDDIVSE